MTYTLRRIGVVTSALLAITCGRQSREPAVSQAVDPLFVNGGFEDGTRNPWVVTVLKNTQGLLQAPPTQYSDLRLATCTLGTTGCQDLTSVVTGATPESVPLAGLSASAGVPMYPKFGSYSLVVNKQGYNENANTIKQAYTTTSADVDPADGKIHVRFALAPALQAAGHTATQQPYFYVILRNNTKLTGGNPTVLYQTFNYSNEPGIPWQQQGLGTSAVMYTDWQIFDVAPGNGYLTVGDTVELEAVASGCQPGGHWGEVYVDGFGAQLPSLSIGATGPALANAGTDITYTFLAKNSTSLLASNVVATEAIPPNTTFVSMVPPPGVTCTGIPSVGGTGTIRQDETAGSLRKCAD